MPCYAVAISHPLLCFFSCFFFGLKVYDDWQEAWESRLSAAACEGAGLIRSCFGDCVAGTVAESCHWNPELSCPLSDCDEDVVSVAQYLL